MLRTHYHFKSCTQQNREQVDIYYMLTLYFMFWQLHSPTNETEEKSACLTATLISGADTYHCCIFILSLVACTKTKFKKNQKKPQNQNKEDAMNHSSHTGVSKRALFFWMASYLLNSQQKYVQLLICLRTAQVYCYLVYTTLKVKWCTRPWKWRFTEVPITCGDTVVCNKSFYSFLLCRANTWGTQNTQGTSWAIQVCHIFQPSPSHLKGNWSDFFKRWLFTIL